MPTKMIERDSGGAMPAQMWYCLYADVFGRAHEANFRCRVGEVRVRIGVVEVGVDVGA